MDLSSYQEYLNMASNGTCIFWDVHDYPVPQGLEPDAFIQNIKRAIKDIIKEEEGEVLILAYVVDEKSLPLSYLDHSRIRIISGIATPDHYQRRVLMLLKLVFFELDNRAKTNMLLISREADEEISNDRIEQAFFISILVGLKFRGHNVFLAVAGTVLGNPEMDYWKDSVLLWKTLSRVTVSSS